MNALETIAFGIVPRNGHDIEELVVRYDDGTEVTLRGETLHTWLNSLRLLLAMMHSFEGVIKKGQQTQEGEDKPAITSEELRKRNRRE